MHSRDRQALAVGLLAVDAMALFWASGLAISLSDDISTRSNWSGTSSAGLSLLLVGPFLTLILLRVEGLYHLDDLFGGHREYAGVLRACTYAAFALLFIAFLLSVHLSRSAAILSWGLSSLFLGTGRFAFRRVVFRVRRSGRTVRRVLIIGADEHAVTIANQLSNPATGWQVLGFLDDYQPVGSTVADGLRVIGDPSQARQLARESGASDLILVPHAVSWEAQRDLLEMAAIDTEPTLLLAPGLYHLLATSTRTVDANFVPLLSLERLRITGLDATLKVILDYGISFAALPALVALLSAQWLACRMSGGGPLLERHPAFGRHRKRFEVLYLSKPPDASPDAGLRLLAWRLRQQAARSRLTKLPNILNVLSGRMSLVGPRALTATPEERGSPWSQTLLLVLPGITGPHPGNGSQWSPAEQVILDVAYVREYSLWVDLRLLFASFIRTLRRERALPASYRPADAKPVPAAEISIR